MFCTRCGQPVAQGSAFCSHCGNALTVAAEPQQPSPAMPAPEWQPSVYPDQPNTPPQGYYAPPAPQGYGEPRNKGKKTGLILGLSAGVMVLIAIVLLFVWPGFLNTVPVAGIWYSDSRGEVIKFGSGQSFDAYTYYGDFDGDYEYDKGSGEGHIEMSDGRDFDFIVQKDMLYVDDMGAFTRADDRFDIDGFIDDATKEYGMGENGT